MRPIRLTKQLAAAADNGICQAQTTAGAGNLTLNGVLVASGVGVLDTQRKIGIFSSGNLSALTFTVSGTDDQNREVSESLAGPNNSTVSTVLDFKTVTAVAVDGAVGTNVIVGTTSVGATQPIPLDLYGSEFNVGLGLKVSGTINYTVQYTFDDIFSGVGPFDWTNHSDLTGKTGAEDASFIAPVTACRLVVNSGDGSVTITVTQG